MTQRTLAALINLYRGKPILVIGGGPSVMPDLKKLAAEGCEPACVLSANEHGTKQPYFKPNYIVNADKIHCLAKDVNGIPITMRDYLAQFDLPTINKHSFADYRLADWGFSGNTGLTAIVVAAALGGDPVIVTGIDCWQGGRHYFHDGYPGAVPHEWRPLPPTKLRPRHHTYGVGVKAVRKMPQLRVACEGANIRPCSGPLLSEFPVYEHGRSVTLYSGSAHAKQNMLPPTEPTAYAKQAARDEHLCTTVRGFEFSIRDRVPKGAKLALSDTEARTLSQAGKIIIDSVLRFDGKLR